MVATAVVATAMVAGLVAVAAPAGALSASGVVISQVFGGGGLTGAPFNADFVELHNTGSAAVDLTGWDVSYWSASGTAASQSALTGLIAPGGYYLVQEGAAVAGGGSNLPIPDAIGPTNLSSTAGRVALVSPTGVVDDLVGYGAGVSTFEGTGSAPAPSATTSVQRLGSGCQDTDDNSADFVVGPPVPRGSATPFQTCGPVAPPPSASATQTMSAVVEAGTGGVLSIAAGQPSIDFGPITAGTSSGAVPVGDIFTTNTLANDASWSTSVAATGLADGSNTIPFQNLTFAPGGSILPGPGAIGAPSPGTAGPFSGSGSGPGVFSDAHSLTAADASVQGSFTQTGSTVTLAVPASQAPAAYGGTLQYTVLAGPAL